MQTVDSTPSVRTDSTGTGCSSLNGTLAGSATVETPTLESQINAYWFLVSAFEHVNLATRKAVDTKDRKDALAIVSDLRWQVLQELPTGIVDDLIYDQPHHQAIADKRRHLMALEHRAGGGL